MLNPNVCIKIYDCKETLCICINNMYIYIYVILGVWAHIYNVGP